MNPSSPAFLGGAVAWALAGAVVTFAVLTAASIGLFVLPAAVVTLVIALRRSDAWPAFGIGVGAVLLFIAAIHRGPDAVDAWPWLVAGLAFSVAGAAATLHRLRGPRA